MTYRPAFRTAAPAALVRIIGASTASCQMRIRVEHDDRDDRPEGLSTPTRLPVSPSLPLLVHVHAVAFSTWMLLFLAQSTLGRPTGRIFIVGSASPQRHSFR
jgi:hypothetical protein